MSGNKSLRGYEQLEQELDRVKKHNTGLFARIYELAGLIEEARGMVERNRNRAERVEKKNAMLEKAVKELDLEIKALETSLLFRITEKGGCSTCEDRSTEHCPGPDLYGRTVLYVGGHQRLVPHYRQLVEKHGGRFVHHDGGREVAYAALPKMLSTADVVLCPVDCVSHSACICVKRMCKQNGKPFVMMRSSGLSSLARGLCDIVQ